MAQMEQKTQGEKKETETERGKKKTTTPKPQEASKQKNQAYEKCSKCWWVNYWVNVETENSCFMHQFTQGWGVRGYGARRRAYYGWSSSRTGWDLTPKMDLVFLAHQPAEGSHKHSVHRPCPCLRNIFFLFQINIKLVILVSRARIWQVVGVVILSNWWESFWMF